MTLTREEATLASLALRVAAEVYKADAETCNGNARLFAQFQTQRARAEELADKIEAQS